MPDGKDQDLDLDLDRGTKDEGRRMKKDYKFLLPYSFFRCFDNNYGFNYYYFSYSNLGCYPAMIYVQLLFTGV
jgi:hypothetical protein